MTPEDIQRREYYEASHASLVAVVHTTHAFNVVILGNCAGSFSQFSPSSFE